MKLKDLKDILNSLSEQELKQELMYYSDYMLIGGGVEDFYKNQQTLYDIDGELFTYSELIEDGFEDEYILSLDVASFEGDYLIKI